jgi:hypothetical protein
MIVMPTNRSPVLHSVEPHSPQKNDVTRLPLSAAFEICFGFPERREKLASGTTWLLE